MANPSSIHSAHTIRCLASLLRCCSSIVAPATAPSRPSAAVALSSSSSSAPTNPASIQGPATKKSANKKKMLTPSPPSRPAHARADPSIAVVAGSRGRKSLGLPQQVIDQRGGTAKKPGGRIGWLGWPRVGVMISRGYGAVESRIGKTREGQSNSFGRALPLPRSEGLMLIEGPDRRAGDSPSNFFFRAHLRSATGLLDWPLARRAASRLYLAGG